MKRLYLLRHSKAGHTSKKLLGDHERALTEKGKMLCSAVGDCLSRIELLPELILCSSATRAQQTAQYVLESLNTDIQVEIEPKLYLAEPNEILNCIHRIDESVSSVMVVGHNPGMHHFSIWLAGKGDKKKVRTMRSNFPPPSLATFDIDENWFNVSEQSGELVDFFIAKNTPSKAA